jgi:hypothetical protein
MVAGELVPRLTSIGLPPCPVGVDGATELSSEPDPLPPLLPLDNIAFDGEFPFARGAACPEFTSTASEPPAGGRPPPAPKTAFAPFATPCATRFEGDCDAVACAPDCTWTIHPRR